MNRGVMSRTIVKISRSRNFMSRGEGQCRDSGDFETDGQRLVNILCFSAKPEIAIM